MSEVWLKNRENQDFSWDSLRRRAWTQGGSGKSLQDYWRRGPGSGREKSPDADTSIDEAMKRSGELVESNGKLCHVVHALDRDARAGAIAERQIKGRLAACAQTGGVDGVVFAGVVFPVAVALPEGLNITVDFSWAWFSQGVKFEAVCFGDKSNFSNARFDGEAHFDDATFGAEVSFANCWFTGLAYFHRGPFGDDADFSGACFGAWAGFNNRKFGRRATFDRTSFGEASFLQVELGNKASFDGAIFTGLADFSQLSCLEDACFVDASFLSDAEFSDARFCGVLEFNATRTAESSADGKRLGVTQDISFRRALFAGKSNFTNRTFARVVNFDQTCWRDAPLFHGAILRQDVSFSGAAFPCIEEKHWRYWRAPWVSRQAKLKPKMRRATGYSTWAEYKGGKSERADRMAPPLDPLWPRSWLLAGRGWTQTHASKTGARSLKQHRYEGSEQRPSLEQQYASLESAFRTLKLAMENARARVEEARFFKLELLARRRRLDRSQVSSAEKFFSGLYHLFADYGESTLRPAMVLVFTVCLCTIAYWGFAQESWTELFSKLPGIGGSEWDPDFVHALLLSIRSVVQPFSIWGPDATGGADPLPASLAAEFAFTERLLVGDANPLIRFISSLESAASITLFFLFLLALRRRFQIN